jgi:hypothetical protein
MATDKAKEYKSLIDEGFTQAQIARMFGIDRRNVWRVLNYNGMIEEKETKPLPFIWYDGVRYIRTLTNQFYEMAGVTSIQQAVWFKETGDYPEKGIVRHKDGNPENNGIENLELVEKE